MGERENDMNGLLMHANGSAHPLFTIVIMRNIKVSLSSDFSQRLRVIVSLVVGL